MSSTCKHLSVIAINGTICLNSYFFTIQGGLVIRYRIGIRTLICGLVRKRLSGTVRSVLGIRTAVAILISNNFRKLFRNRSSIADT